MNFETASVLYIVLYICGFPFLPLSIERHNMEHWTKINGIEGLYRHSNGTYYARFTQPRKTFRSLRTRKLREARTAFRAMQGANGEAPPPTPQRNGARITLGELAKTFLEEECPALPVTSKTKVRIRQSLDAVRNYTALWKEPVERLTGKIIRRSVEKTKHLSNASRNYMLYGLRKAFAYAEEQGFVTQNPTQGIKTFPERPRRLDLPTDKQFGELVDLLRHPEGKSEGEQGRPEVAFTFLFLCFTGLRMGEARAAKWKDLDGATMIVRGTKTKAAFRYVPVIRQLSELFGEMKAFRGELHPDQTIMRRKRIDKPIRVACDKLGLPRLRHHDLRHYFATKAIQSGVDVPTVAKWLGHNDGGVLAMKVYANVIDEHSRAQAAKLVFPD